MPTLLYLTLNRFTIKDIENFTGIKAHTIRIWEQRYQLFKPKRKDTNHRVYDSDDLKALLRIAYLYHHGIKISRIASLSEAEQNNISLEIASESHGYEIHINDLINATLDYDTLRFQTLLDKLLQQEGFETGITKVIYPFLEKIGVLWLTGSISAAQEHFCSNIIRNKMIVAIEQQSMNYASDEHFLLFLPEGEFHEIPLLFTHYLLKKNGRMVTNFGANVSVEDLLPFLAQRKVTHIYTHLLTSMTQQALEAFVQALYQLYPQVEIWLSGPPSRLPAIPVYKNVRVIRSMSELLAL
ncbi:MerR family transcriptional regulator [Chitinophaga vietnamensis]|uniref:MerR family transcriptional regulator n=1 Tax=Chitinophaga vietnamensis TaxID=2593957 RepID=UPI001178C587|nr:MerR family transcriptional regulator [Chitinophaga vietnamensis]